MYQVIKRDGHVAEFSLNRISSAIMKAFDATHIPYAPDVIDLLSLQVTADYADKIRDGRIDVETIQDSVEAVLQRAGYAEVAKAYILYRKQREKIRNLGSTIPAEEIPLLFERFHKSDKSRSEDKDGYGLGLYIVKTILAQHKEQITVTSQDGVTAFTFTMQMAHGAPREVL